MNISYELAKVKDAFSKVRNDMNFLAGKVSENYDEFLRHHQKLANEVAVLSETLRRHIETIRASDFHASAISQNSKEMLDVKGEIKELKKEIMSLQKEHYDVEHLLSEIKKSNKDVKELKDKLHSSELEIFLMKEKLAEKDVEMKQIREVNRHMYNVIEELSNLELELITGKKNK